MGGQETSGDVSRGQVSSEEVTRIIVQRESLQGHARSKKVRWGPEIKFPGVWLSVKFSK